MTPQQQRLVSAKIMELIDRCPAHRSIDGVLRCQQGCARRLHDHLSAIERAEKKGTLPKIPSR